MAVVNLNPAEAAVVLDGADGGAAAIEQRDAHPVDVGEIEVPQLHRRGAHFEDRASRTGRHGHALFGCLHGCAAVGRQ